MTIEPGEYFVVYYNFPKVQKKVRKEEMRRGLTIPIPEAHCSVTVPPSDVGKDVTITCKVSTNLISLFYKSTCSAIVFTYALKVLTFMVRSPISDNIIWHFNIFHFLNELHIQLLKKPNNFELWFQRINHLANKFTRF